MHFISYLLILPGLFITTFTYPQSTRKNPQNVNFASPLDIPLFLSSNYGEYRTGHFHAGVDFKTQQIEGKNVFAVDSGYVYRIAVQAGGYGNALYLKHPSGYTTLYGHLSKLEPSIAKYVKDQQYKKRSFTIDLYPDRNQFIFKKGAFIGLSGNSGTSFGAHLHFEVRDISGTIPLNPLQYGFAVKDNTDPEIRWLKIYALDAGSLINGSRNDWIIKVQNGKTGYFIPDTITVSGSIGLGIESYDFLDNTSNQCGPGTIEVTIDSKPVFVCRIDSIPFRAGGYINSYYDYGEMQRSGKKFQKLFIDPNNKLSIYKLALNRGILHFTDELMHTVRIIVKDTYGNESELKFNLKVEAVSESLPVIPDTFFVNKFSYDSLNVFENQHIRVVIPRDALFDNIDFQYSESKNDSIPFSLIHKVHNRYTPLLNAAIISIRPDNMPQTLHAKALIASRAIKGGWAGQGGEYKNGYVTTRIRSFGEFIVTVDTVAPTIDPVNFVPKGSYAEGQVISFAITDTLSGIQKYSGFIDNNWALFEYDAKNDLLSYSIDSKRITRGILHNLEIVVSDYKGNITRYRNKFYY